jgi:hypothetical protein
VRQYNFGPALGDWLSPRKRHGNPPVTEASLIFTFSMHTDRIQEQTGAHFTRVIISYHRVFEIIAIDFAGC